MSAMLWFVLAVILAIVEILVPALITIWFAISALLVFLLSGLFAWAKISLVGQLNFFILFALLLLFLTRPWAKRYLQERKGQFRGDFRGSKLEISKVLKEGVYEGKFKGSIWTLISEEKDLQVGDSVLITGYEGNRIIIKKEEA